MKKIAFILNPISGTHHKRKVLEYIKEIIAQRVEYEPFYYTTKCAKDAYYAAKNFVENNYSIIVAIGGDGTINEVAGALVNSNSVLGIIPIGSGNGLARHLKIPLNYKKAVDVILKGKTKLIDAAKVNGKVFFCTAGIGYEAAIGNKFNMAGSRGLLTYMETCTKVFFNYKPQKYLLKIGGNSFDVEAFSITFANCNQWGNNTFIAPNADISDGMLDVVVWKKTPAFIMPILTADLFLKTINNSNYIQIFRCKELEVYRAEDGLLQYDGESGNFEKDLHVSVLHNAVKVIVNKGYEEISEEK